MLVLPALSFVLLWLLLNTHKDAIGFGRLSRRGTLVLAFLAFELILLVITEVTSIRSNFTSGAVTAAWAVVLIILAVLARSPATSLLRRNHSLAGLWGRAKGVLRRLAIDERIGIAVIVVIFGIFVALAWKYLPSNRDSLVYHLARVEHWIENRSVGAFATQYLPQVEFPPLAEYNLAILHLLAGTDRFDAGVDVFATFICVVGASELARLLGAEATDPDPGRDRLHNHPDGHPAGHEHRERSDGRRRRHRALDRVHVTVHRPTMDVAGGSPRRHLRPGLLDQDHRHPHARAGGDRPGGRRRLPAPARLRLANGRPPMRWTGRDGGGVRVGGGGHLRHPERIGVQITRGSDVARLGER